MMNAKRNSAGRCLGNLRDMQWTNQQIIKKWSNGKKQILVRGKLCKLVTVIRVFELGKFSFIRTYLQFYQRNVSSTKHHFQSSLGSKDRTIGCSVEWKCLVACLFFDESQHPTWPQIRQRRKCTQESPIFRQSSQPTALGFTSSWTSLRCLHPESDIIVFYGNLSNKHAFFRIIHLCIDELAHKIRSFLHN